MVPSPGVVWSAFIAFSSSQPPSFPIHSAPVGQFWARKRPPNSVRDKREQSQTTLMSSSDGHHAYTIKPESQSLHMASCSRPRTQVGCSSASLGAQISIDITARISSDCTYSLTATLLSPVVGQPSGQWRRARGTLSRRDAGRWTHGIGSRDKSTSSLDQVAAVATAACCGSRYWML